MDAINLQDIRLKSLQQTSQMKVSSADLSNKTKDARLWKISLQFEAMLIQQMMSAMRKTVPKSELSPSNFANDTYSSLFDQAISDSASKRGSLGIANSVYRQLSNQAQPFSTDKNVMTGHQSKESSHGAD
ncbi:MAG: rod-binding protein [Mariprofundaceae bacterium]